MSPSYQWAWFQESPPSGLVLRMRRFGDVSLEHLRDTVRKSREFEVLVDTDYILVYREGGCTHVFIHEELASP